VNWRSWYRRVTNSLLVMGLGSCAESGTTHDNKRRIAKRSLLIRSIATSDGLLLNAVALQSHYQEQSC